MRKVPIYGDLRIKNGNMHLIKDSTITVDNSTLRKVGDMVNFVNKHLDLSSLAEEQFWILAFNAQLQILGLFRVSQGEVAYSVANTAGIFKRLLLTNAFSFVAIHNHPSGSVAPSADDIRTTQNLKKVAEMHGMRLLDHIIIGGKKYTSIRKVLSNTENWDY